MVVELVQMHRRIKRGEENLILQLLGILRVAIRIPANARLANI
jgi:hypothetical protein